MNEILLQHRGKFNFYNVETGRFRLTQALGVDELQKMVMEEQGEQGVQDLRGQVERSKSNRRSLSDVLFFNRAGEANRHLPVAECIEYFLT